MINLQGLRELWISKGYTQDEVAKEIGISDRTFRNRLKNGTLTTNNINRIIDLLDIQNPSVIFFKDSATQ